MSAAITHTLKHPIKVTYNAGKPDERVEEITVIELRRAKAKDLRAIDGQPGEIAQAIALMVRLSGMPVSVIDELDAEDFTAITEVIEKGF